MLDVIGAGATATSAIDWHAAWKNAPESAELDRELIGIHDQGRKQSIDANEHHSEFAAAHATQLSALLIRSFRVSYDYFRSRFGRS